MKGRRERGREKDEVGRGRDQSGGGEEGERRGDNADRFKGQRAVPCCVCEGEGGAYGVLETTGIYSDARAGAVRARVEGARRGRFNHRAG